jgi:hypothetical protein
MPNTAPARSRPNEALTRSRSRSSSLAYGSGRRRDRITRPTWRTWSVPTGPPGSARAGTGFYRFAGVEAGAVKRRYRELLDAAPWDAAEQDRFLDKVARAYPLNIALLDDLGATVERRSA